MDTLLDYLISLPNTAVQMAFGAAAVWNFKHGNLYWCAWCAGFAVYFIAREASQETARRIIEKAEQKGYLR